MAEAKRPRGRPRKSAAPASQPAIAEARPDAAEPLDALPEDLAATRSDDDLEAELQRAMDAVGDVAVFAPIDTDDQLVFDTEIKRPSAPEPPKPAAKVKKMTTTTRKMMKFGYSQVLRAADSLTKGKVPGEQMAYILRNDEAADAILDEILNELDQKYKLEQYLGPESKLALFTAQLCIQARESRSSSSSDA